MTTQLTTAHDLGLIIRDRRRALGLKQQVLADQVGVSRQWLVEVERGKPRAEVALILRTLAALGLRMQVTTADGSAETQQPSAAQADATMHPATPVIDLAAILARARGIAS